MHTIYVFNLKVKWTINHYLKYTQCRKSRNLTDWDLQLFYTLQQSKRYIEF